MNKAKKMKKIEPLRVVCKKCGPLPNTMQAETLAKFHSAFTHHNVAVVPQSVWAALPMGVPYE